MANEEHLKILRKGVRVWNKWRQGNPDVRSDLSGAVLMGVDLSEANLMGADLRGAFLVSAHLSRATLVRADLSEAKLVEADLRDADLQEAKLYKANLFNASLNNARLEKADLTEAHVGGGYAEGASFREANLSGATVYGADDADFTYADLTGANLSESHFRHAKFEGVRLNRSSLARADFEGADLTEADLTEANLSEAQFLLTILASARLTGADFSDATFGRTILAHLDLGTVKGLETVYHTGPSTIGVDTLVLSQGKVPEVFLQGCGVPDTFITYAASLIGRPIQFYSCFISYSSKDQAFAERLYNDLQAKGVRCWFAPEDMKIGDEIRSRIDQEIRLYDRLLLILSEASVQSEWVKDEVETAFEKERVQKRTVLFPVRLDDAINKTEQAWAAKLRRQRHIGDMSQWSDPESYQRAFDRLLRDLQAEPEKPR